MDYPDSPDLFEGKFTDGDPVAGIPASVASADHMNAVYDELKAVILAGGLTPDAANKEQVLAAINNIRKDDLYDKTLDFFASGGRKNLLINGTPQIWQRGDSFSASGYTADRWYTDLINATCTRDAKGILVTVNSGGGRCEFRQALENSLVKRFRGKKLTFSMNMGFENSGGTVKLSATWSNSSDSQQNQTATIIEEEFIVETSSFRGSITFVVPDAAYGLRVNIVVSDTQSAGAKIWLSDAQLESGELGTYFEFRHEAEELLLCKRYASLEKFDTYLGLGNIYLYSGGLGGGISHKLTTPLRSTPSVTIKSGSLGVGGGGPTETVSSISANAISNNNSATIGLSLTWSNAAGHTSAYSNALTLFLDSEL